MRARGARRSAARRVLAGATLAVATVGALRAGTGCSSSARRDATSDASDEWPISRPHEASIPDDAGDAASPAIPAGWVPFTDYDPSCGFYVPSSRDVLPPPITWQACEPAVVPPGAVCEQMKVTWTPVLDDSPAGYMLDEAWLQPDGTYTMAIDRAMPGMGMYVVADADGPVHSAFLATNETTCRPFPDDLRDGRVVYRVFDRRAKGTLSEYGGGALVSGIDDLQPRVFLRFDDSVARGYLVGQPGVLENQSYPTNVLVLHDWTDPTKILMKWSAAQDPGLQETGLEFQGQALFWQAANDPAVRLRVWTADAGARDFISFGSDTSQAAGDLGTDGHDMVWLDGSGRTQPYGPYPTAAFMTSPSTADPAQLRPRRLRSEPGAGDAGSGLGASATQVGCGYAARQFPGGIRILRLSDGVSWVLPMNAGASRWGWVNALAVTCTHFYGSARGQVDNTGSWITTIARLRLDSLGSGIAPD
jgi:hypothetical protein